jgi:hypothetical protein
MGRFYQAKAFQIRLVLTSRGGRVNFHSSTGFAKFVRQTDANPTVVLFQPKTLRVLFF